MKKNQAIFPTTLLTVIAVAVIAICVWGLKTLYYDVEPLKLNSKSLEVASDPSAERLTLPKLFVFTPENEPSETEDSNTGAKKSAGAVSDNDIIMRVIVQNKHRLQRCYENHLRNQPDSRGEITLELSMTAFGTAQAVRVEKSDFENDPLFASCLESVIKRLRFKFENTDKNFVISIPLEFQ